MRFKGRPQVHNIEMQGEVASVGIEIAASYLEDLVMIINKGGYTKEQILTINKIAFMRKDAIEDILMSREKKLSLTSQLQRTSSLECNNKAGMTTHLFTTQFT